MSTRRGVTVWQVLFAALTLLIYAAVLKLAEGMDANVEEAESVTDATSFAAGQEAAREELMPKIALAYRQGTLDAPKASCR